MLVIFANHPKAHKRIWSSMEFLFGLDFICNETLVIAYNLVSSFTWHVYKRNISIFYDLAYYAKQRTVINVPMTHKHYKFYILDTRHYHFLNILLIRNNKRYRLFESYANTYWATCNIVHTNNFSSISFYKIYYILYICHLRYLSFIESFILEFIYRII